MESIFFLRKYDVRSLEYMFLKREYKQAIKKLLGFCTGNLSVYYKLLPLQTK